MKKLIWMSWLLFLATPSFAGEISQVIVRNQNFEIVKVVDDKISLQQFEEIWKSKTKVKTPVAPKWLLKLDIEGKGHGDRWFYDPQGYVQVLSKAKVPIYRIPAFVTLNNLIGTHNQEDAPDQKPVR
jgi:hypothetical protein